MSDNRSLITLISELHTIAEEYGLPLKVPRLFVVGAQSRGKSSLVEAFAGLTFNFCANDIASRFPIDFTMINDPQYPHPVWNINSRGGGKNLTTEKVSRFVEQRNLELAKENTVSSEPVKVEVRWERCPNLSFIDLPGLRALAMNEKDNLLKVQIEEMIQKVITEHSKQSNVRFLVVEDAKEDTANYFGYVAIQDMAKKAMKELGEDESKLESKFILVLNKFDNFMSSKDNSVQDKRQKIESIFPAFNAKQIPVYIISLPNLAEKNSFLPDEAKNESERDRETIIIEGFEKSLRIHSEQDKEFICDTLGIDKYDKFIGFHQLKHKLESTMIQQYISALPEIKSRLISKRIEIEKVIGLDGAKSDFATLPYLCTRFAISIESLFTGSYIESSSRLRPHYTLPQEYASLPPPIGATFDAEFSYRKSSVWRNNKYQKELSSLIYENTELLGGGQIRRALNEFQLSVYALRQPILDNKNFDNKVASTRQMYSAMPGIGQTPWSAVISTIIQNYCSDLLENDTKFLAYRLENILLSWFDIAIESIAPSSGDAGDRDIYKSQLSLHTSQVPPPQPAPFSEGIKAELKVEFQNIIHKWAVDMQKRLFDFIQFTFQDYDETWFEQKVIQTLGTNFSVGPPTPMEIFKEIMDNMKPKPRGRKPNNSLLASNVEEAKGNQVPLQQCSCGNSVVDLDALDLMLDNTEEPNNPETLDKIKTILSLQLRIGSKRIADTFRFIFEVMFKKPLCKELASALVSWSQALPEKLEQRALEGNEMLSIIAKQIHVIDSFQVQPNV